MAVESIPSAQHTGSASAWRGTAGIAVLAALATLAIHILGGLPTLSQSNGDNDSLLRLVQIRDLLAGQGWFDLHQYRMGPEGGFVMHWSRLVDAPVAAIILLATALTGSVSVGETVALVAWPTLLFAASMWFLLRAALCFAGETVLLPAALIGAAGLHFLGIFAPGNLDHHNLQLVLTLAMVSLLLDAAAGKAGGSGAGACAALMLAIGMETAPYVATAGAVVAIWYLVEGQPAARTAIGFGLGFAGVSAAVFFGTVPAGAWGVAQCDAFSVTQFALAAIGGLGLAAAATLPGARDTLLRRLVGLGVVAILVAAAAVTLFPQCLGDPFADMDPRLKSYWLNSITEAQPIWSILANKPAMAAGYYATALFGASWLALLMVRRGVRREDALVAAFLGAAILVSFWQVRGSTFSIPLAVLPLSAWVAGWRARAAGGGASTATVLKMAAAWLVSFNVAWSAAATGIAKAFPDRPPAARSGIASGAGPCEAAADYARLAALPAQGVLVVSNLGAPILRHTAHRVLAGPYHRNVAGNLLALDAFMGSTREAETVARANGLSLVALCRGNDESQVLAKWAPDGFVAALMRGDVPDWLEPMAATPGQALELYRIRQ